MRTSSILMTLAAAALVGLTGCNRDTRTTADVRAAGNEAFARGDYATALAEFRLLSDEHVFSPRARFDVGRTLLAMGNARDAAAELEIAYRVDPAIPGLLETMTDAFVAAGRHDDLYATLQSRARQSGDIADWNRLGVAMQRVGSMDEADAAFRTAARIDGGKTAEPQLRLAQFYQSIGDEEREMQRLRAVMYIDPANESARQRLRELGITPGPTLAIQPPELDGSY